MNVDYLIVGGGITGRLLQSELMVRGYNAIVYDKSNANHSTRVAAGLVNPVVGKFFTIGWRSDQYFPSLSSYYRNLEETLKSKFFSSKPMKRIIASAGEQNRWLSKAHLDKYIDFCSFSHEDIKGLNTSFGILNIHLAGEMDTEAFLSACNKMLPTQSESFDHTLLDVEKKEYQSFSYKNIVFCEGYESYKNPYFKNYMDVVPTKGELLEIRALGIPKDSIYLGPVFIQFIGNDLWRVGATYEQNQISLEPTSLMRKDLELKLNKLIDVPYDVVNHYCGIRPASIDRKPIMGKHPHIDSMYVVNGMGSKAISMAPLLMREMSDYMEQGIPLPSEVDLKRFC
jgi:glycine/D-amino acid oxidase-like deaminating enzyme